MWSQGCVKSLTLTVEVHYYRGCSLTHSVFIAPHGSIPILVFTQYQVRGPRPIKATHEWFSRQRDDAGAKCVWCVWLHVCVITFAVCVWLHVCLHVWWCLFSYRCVSECVCACLHMCDCMCETSFSHHPLLCCTFSIWIHHMFSSCVSANSSS